MTYIKPTSDIFIKYLFGKEENKDLLLKFINAVQASSGFPLIKSVEIKNPFNIKAMAYDKESILDIKATDENGKIYNIEVQTSGNETFKHRSLYYWAKLYSSQLKEGEMFGNLFPVICINILDFNLLEDLDKYHSTFMLKEIKSADIFLTDHLAIHYLELHKLKEFQKDKILDHWLYFLKNEGKEEEDENMKILLKENSDIGNAHKKYIAFTRDEDLVDAYEAHMKWKRDYNTGIDYAMREGLVKGEKKGLIKGSLANALKMKKDGMSIEKIAQYTGLTIQEIEQI